MEENNGRKKKKGGRHHKERKEKIKEERTKSLPQYDLILSGNLYHVELHNLYMIPSSLYPLHYVGLHNLSMITSCL
jgi:hypothetical protein